MDQRLRLQGILEEVMDGAGNVYFQPPSNIVMTYPCIVYSRDRASALHADNQAYRYTKLYSVTYIARDPDSTTPDEIGRLPLCTFSRHFTTEGLHHDVFNLYF